MYVAFNINFITFLSISTKTTKVTGEVYSVNAMHSSRFSRGKAAIIQPFGAGIFF
jgi:hypothetical protein